MLLSPPLVFESPVLPPIAAFRSTPRVPAPLVLPAPSPPAPSTTQGSTFKAKRIIEMEKVMEQKGVKCFVVMANRTDLAKFRGARVQAI